MIVHKPPKIGFKATEFFLQCKCGTCIGTNGKQFESVSNEKKKTAVEAYGNGTTGYRIKNGPNKGKVLGHISTKGNNNF